MKTPQRDQVEFRACSWNDLLPEDHQARIVWQYVLGLDLSPLYRRIKAVERHAGQSAIDPRMLFALWLYATLRGIGSARELARRCRSETGEAPFQWICGGVSVNYHTLADFRTQHVELLDAIFTGSIAALLEEKLVTLDRVAQDGMKVRAGAGAASFRRRPTLEQHHADAKAQIEALKAELASDPAAANRRQQAARQRAAREREARLAKALEHMSQVEAQKKGQENKEKARVSTTDPEARVMKMGDGGFRPAYNVQLATDAATQIITGVKVIATGSDRGQLAPMVQQHQERYEAAPQEMLADGGFATKDDITAVSPPAGRTTVYAPVQKSKKQDVDPHTPRAGDSPAVAEWRTRMATDEAKEIYKQRAATAECVNAHARNRGLYQVRVRGAPRVLAVVLWHVLAQNLMRAVALRAALATNEV
ncbi:MAG: IS1182 family transposase [Acidobacteria bacterium]|nr:IS1182 family transposase [Acidobacteriota bacterium]